MTARPARTRRGVLRQPSQFEAVLRSGLRISSRNFVARILANEADEPRLGLIAGKKAASRAVDRNRAKRLIRETFRAAAHRFGALDVTIQLRSDLRSVENDVVRAELQTLFETVIRRLPGRDATAPAVTASRSTSDRQ